MSRDKFDDCKRCTNRHSRICDLCDFGEQFEDVCEGELNFDDDRFGDDEE